MPLMNTIELARPLEPSHQVMRPAPDNTYLNPTLHQAHVGAGMLELAANTTATSTDNETLTDQQRRTRALGELFRSHEGMFDMWVTIR